MRVTGSPTLKALSSGDISSNLKPTAISCERLASETFAVRAEDFSVDISDERVVSMQEAMKITVNVCVKMAVEVELVSEQETLKALTKPLCAKLVMLSSEHVAESGT
jgi:hypothetical protein